MYFDRKLLMQRTSTPVVRGKESKESRNLQSLKDEFKNLYIALLPMTNGQVFVVVVVVVVVIMTTTTMMMIMIIMVAAVRSRCLFSCS